MTFVTRVVLFNIISSTFAGILEHNRNIRLADDEVLEQGDILRYRVPSNSRAIAKKPKKFLWPNAIVPYVISSTFKSEHVRNIHRAMRTIERKTCVKFVKRTSQRSFVNILYTGGCTSFVGRAGGAQKLTLGGACPNGVQTIIHELMHALGFEHEHQRFDRDKYIKIIMENVDPTKRYSFKLEPNSRLYHVPIPFDYNSVMLYPAYAFAKKAGLVTMISRTTTPIKDFHQKPAISDGDVASINYVYCSRKVKAQKKRRQFAIIKHV